MNKTMPFMTGPYVPIHHTLAICFGAKICSGAEPLGRPKRRNVAETRRSLLRALVGTPISEAQQCWGFHRQKQFDRIGAAGVPRGELGEPMLFCELWVCWPLLECPFEFVWKTGHPYTYNQWFIIMFMFPVAQSSICRTTLLFMCCPALSGQLPPWKLQQWQQMQIFWWWCCSAMLTGWGASNREYPRSWPVQSVAAGEGSINITSRKWTQTLKLISGH